MRKWERKTPLRHLPPLHPKAVSDYQNGVPVRHILKEYGYCHHSFYRLLDENKIKRRGHEFRRPKLDDRAASDIKAGVPMLKIKNKYGYCDSTLYRLIDRNGLPRRGATPPSLDPNAVADYRNGVATRRIYKKYRCGWQSLYRLLDEHGVERRRGGLGMIQDAEDSKARRNGLPVDALARRIRYHESAGYGRVAVMKNLHIPRRSFYRAIDLIIEKGGESA